jgi:hypothetical protein
MKPFRILSAAAATLLIAPSLFADTTVRYKNELKIGGGAPAQMLGPAVETIKSKLPTSTVIQMKGKLVRKTSSPFVTVSDFEKQVITLFDPARNQFATVYMKDYQDQVLSLLQSPSPMTADAQKVIDSMQSTFSSQKTGKMDTIIGIQVEETEMTLTVTMPAMQGAASSTDAAHPAQLEVVLQMVVHMWNALPSEVERVPALKEFSSVYGDPSADSVMNPAASMGKMFGTLPGMAKGFASMMAAMQEKKAVVLRTEIEMYLPWAQAMLAARAQATGTDQAQAADPHVPFMEMKMEAEEISGAPIDDSVFAAPRDYQLVSVPELLRPYMPAPRTPQAGDAATPAASGTVVVEPAPQK